MQDYAFYTCPGLYCRSHSDEEAVNVELSDSNRYVYCPVKKDTNSDNMCEGDLKRNFGYRL
ncbi:hypothetical protein Hanom_Chr12g01122141 [Helianthus anomalus]